MNVTLVEINIKPERVDEFLEVFRANHEAVLAHKKTPHYLACVEKLEEMMSQPRQKRSFIGLLPQM